MEFAPGIVRAERALTAVMLALTLGVCWLESRSPLAAAVREGRPWLCWLAFEASEGGAPPLFLGVYRSQRRTLDLVYLPPSRALSQVYRDGLNNEADPAGAAKDEADAAQELIAPLLADRGDAARGDFYYAAVPLPEGADAALAGKKWLSEQTRGVGFWTRTPARSTLAPFERALLGIELHRLPPENVRPAWLPEKDQQRGYFGRLLALKAPAPDRAITVEVLNASGRKGFASQATKVLRLNGADVVNFGNLPAAQSRTVVYDRTGRIESAAMIRKMLGCAAAETVTQVNLKRLVDVTVVLAEDCSPH